MPQDRSAKQSSRGVLFFFAVFAVIIAVTFIFRDRPSIRWVENYDAGVKQSVAENKPALVGFYRQGGHFSMPMRDGTWKNAKVVKFVHQTFVPILVNIEKSPEIAKEYGADYDSSYFIRLPDGTRSDQATHGNRMPDEFIAKLQAKLAEVKSKKP
jgi:hypothetical protein